MSAKREIVFDTETTGFDARGLDRITEIGCVEVIDLMPTGKTFHAYINPERDVPQKVTEITGLTWEFLKDKPLFADKAQEFLDFVGDSDLVAHNSDFDQGFINAELERARFDPIPSKRFVDTLKIARAKFPGSPASLDALCRRFDISLTSRHKHGALVDSELLAKVYLELSGGAMHKLDLGGEAETLHILRPTRSQQRPEPLSSRLTDQEKQAHEEFIASLGGDDQSMIWQKYWRRQARA